MRKLVMTSILFMMLLSCTQTKDLNSVTTMVNMIYDVNFERPDGLYTSSDFWDDFGEFKGYSSAERKRTWIENNSLKTTLLANKAASASGLVARTILNNSYDSITMEYRVKFQKGFDWSRGGKLPGFSGGDGNTGKDKADDGKGWSVRLMWRENGKLIPYVYHYNQPKTYGDKFDVSSLTYFQADRWYLIKIKTIINTEANRDGVLEIDVDGKNLFRKTNICFATEDGKRKINQIRWAIFRGGSDETWYSDKEQYIYFDDVKIYTE